MTDKEFDAIMASLEEAISELDGDARTLLEDLDESQFFVPILEKKYLLDS